MHVHVLLAVARLAVHAAALRARIAGERARPHRLVARRVHAPYVFVQLHAMLELCATHDAHDDTGEWRARWWGRRHARGWWGCRRRRRRRRGHGGDASARTADQLKMRKRVDDVIQRAGDVIQRADDVIQRADDVIQRVDDVIQRPDTTTLETRAHLAPPTGGKTLRCICGIQ